MKNILLILPFAAALVVLFLDFTGFPMANFPTDGSTVPVMQLFGFGMGSFAVLALIMIMAVTSGFVSIRGNTSRKMHLLRKDPKLISRSHTIILISGAGILLQTVIIYYLFWRVTTPMI